MPLLTKPLPAKASSAMPLCTLAAAIALALSVAPAGAQSLPHREPGPGELRLGQRVLVDDGTCPAGQVKQVIGARLTAEGVVRERSCIPRAGRR